MANTYNPYSDIQKVYNAKVAWNNATTDEERNNQNSIANAARKRLESYGYGDVVNQISADRADATATRNIMEKYAPNVSDTELITKHNNEISKKINTLYGMQENDHSELSDMYKKEYNDIKNINPFTTDEAKAILAKYDLEGLQGRNNAVASGSASNGGNIDSYAAANALRQQASLVNQGHMVVLDAYQQKIDNARSILEGLGAYQSDSYKGMQNTIGLQQDESQRLFDNGETAKNNETARLEVQAGVTGYTPTEWTIKNDSIYSDFLNADGTFKKEKENVDIQALINQAKASGDTETANKLAVVRYKKIMGNYGEYGQYANQGNISSLKNQITEDARVANMNNDALLKTLETESEDKRYEIDTNKAISDANLANEKYISDASNKNVLDQIKAQTESEKDILKITKELSGDTTSLTDEQKKVMNNAVSNINSLFKNHRSNENKVDILIKDADGKYRFNPNINVNAWDDLVVEQILANTALTDEEKATLIASLDIDTSSMGYLIK